MASQRWGQAMASQRWDQAMASQRWDQAMASQRWDQAMASQRGCHSHHRYQYQMMKIRGRTSLPRVT
ncbi:(P)ppGpp synthetase I/ SpoT/RelA domain protein [Synechococcus sp. BOUM118]|nr:(P)ppGpp synthetase I/ SpoT/RelA domain protein [Synechococcus sp. BOUM118]